MIVPSLDDYIARQPSLVTRKRELLPVVMQRMQIAEGLAISPMAFRRRVSSSSVKKTDASVVLFQQRDGADLVGLGEPIGHRHIEDAFQAPQLAVDGGGG